MIESFKEKVLKAGNDVDNIPRFLRIISEILEEDKHSDYISWSQDGLAILIKDPAGFAQDLLPIYFKHCNYNSFVRQLNLYAFRKQKKYPYDDTFAHNMFIRGKKELLKLIKRKNSGPSNQNKHNIDASYSSEVSLISQRTGEESPRSKKIKLDMSDTISRYEDQIKEITRKNDQLEKQLQQKEHGEIFLKRLVTEVAGLYGFENIKTLALNAHNELKKKNNRDGLDTLIDKGVKEYMYYKNSFSRKTSTLSTSSNASETIFYPFFDKGQTAINIQVSSQTESHTNFWHDKPWNLGLCLSDDDFGILGSDSRKINNLDIILRQLSLLKIHV